MTAELDKYNASIASPVERFSRLRLWQRGGERAVHKPLLVLLALSHLRNSGERWLPFREVAEPLATLIRDFGPPRGSIHPEYPFWRLQTDGVWTVHSDGVLSARNGNTDAKKSELMEKNAVGGFTDEVIGQFHNDPRKMDEVALMLLKSHFPETVQSDLIDRLQLDFALSLRASTRRDPKFRDAVLRAYNYRCAVCSYELRLRDELVGVEAAHIRWVQALGPDEVSNGLALCCMHHKLFDRGAFTLDAELRVLCSKELIDRGTPSSLLQFHGLKIQLPGDGRELPRQEFISWHVKQVFRQPAMNSAKPPGDAKSAHLKPYGKPDRNTDR